MFVIKQVKGHYPGWYVAPPGQDKSYVKHLEDAQVWASREVAEEEKCGNEVVVRLEDCLKGTGRPR